MCCLFQFGQFSGLSRNHSPVPTRDLPLGIYAAKGYTLLEMVSVYLGFPADAPLDTSIIDGNNRVPYLRTICDGIGVPASTKVASAILLG